MPPKEFEYLYNCILSVLLAVFAMLIIFQLITPQKAYIVESVESV